MRLAKVWLTDYRSYEQHEVELDTGLTAILGPNGAGKTNLLEAIGLLATLKSFRGAPTESLIRRGASSAIVRAEGERDGRDVLIELELTKGRTRAQVNKQKLQRTSDLLGALQVTFFAPDDLALVKEGPAVRRQYLDDLMVSLDPRFDSVLSDLDRVLRQRGALLRQARGSLDEATGLTLDVWDAKLGELGQRVTERREYTLGALMPLVGQAYEQLAGNKTEVTATYIRSWDGDALAQAVVDSRQQDVRRGVTTLGPHRDDLRLSLNSFASRVEASQGEQRTLALALRLAGHRLVAQHIGEAPLLLLDDVLSELDPDRASALLDNLPPGQTIITSASGLPPGTVADQTLTFQSPRSSSAESRSDGI